MRTFIQQRSEAVFYRGQRRTAAFHKDSIELIFKFDWGNYAVVHAMVMEGRLVVLFANWGEYFWQLTRSKQMRANVMRAVKKACPRWAELLEGRSRFSMFGFAEDFTGILCPLEIEGEVDVTLIGNAQVWKVAEELKDFVLEVRKEILEGCPLKDWAGRLS